MAAAAALHTAVAVSSSMTIVLIIGSHRCPQLPSTQGAGSAGACEQLTSDVSQTICADSLMELLRDGQDHW